MAHIHSSSSRRVDYTNPQKFQKLRSRTSSRSAALRNRTSCSFLILLATACPLDKSTSRQGAPRISFKTTKRATKQMGY